MITAEMETRARKTANRGGSEELADQVTALRDDLQNLSNTVSRIAKGRMGKAQHMAKDQIDQAQEVAYEKIGEAEDAIKRNPLSAVAIAVGLGFLFGLITRRS